MEEEFKEKLLKLYKDYEKVYGIYKNNFDREFIILYKSPNIRKSLSYPKALVEVTINRILEENETVDHKDRNFLNNSLENLEILDRKDHCKLDVIRVKLVKLQCKLCGILFERRACWQHNNSRKGRAGPFCGRSCAGKYARNTQLGGEKLPPAEEIPKEEREYFTNKD